MAASEARRRRRTRLIALALLVGAAAGGTLVAQRRGALVERFLLWQLARRGIADASLMVARVGLRELALRELRIGDGDLRLDALELRFSPAGLAAGRLDAARVGDLRLRGRIDASGLSLGALDALRADGEGGVPGLPVLPVGRLEVDRAVLVLDTPQGPFEAALALELDADGRGRFHGATGALATFSTPVGVSAAPFALSGDVVFGADGFEARLEPAAFSLTLATRAGPQPITGTTPRLALRGVAGAPTLELRGADGELALLGPGVAARGVGFELRIDPDARLPSGGVAVRELSDRREPARFAPLALDATLEPGDGRLAILGVLRSEVPGVVARLEGFHDVATGGGRIALRVEPLRLGEPGPRPGELLPGLAPLVRSAAGEVEARGELRWGSGGVEGSAELGLRDLTLETRMARIERVNAALHFDGPWPPRTPRGQLVSMARVDFGLELTSGLVRWALEPGGALDVEQAEWRFAGGVVRSAGRFDPSAPKHELVMTLADVELAQLLELVNLEGLTGSGRLEGRLPLSFAGGNARIDAGELRASEAGGSIRYRPRGRAAEALGAAGSALDDFLLALHDFRYERLSLRVDGDPQGEVRVAVSLAGANPAHRGGQPYAFNLNVEGQLGDLVREGGAAYRVPAEIERRLEALSR